MVALLLSTRMGAAQGVYMETNEFLEAAFPNTEPVTKTLWITAEQRAPVESILGHPFAPLRVRYWQQANKTAWILEEIGKERPITIGVAIEDSSVDLVRVLEFRETRGWEVRYPFFTDQFNGAARDDDAPNGRSLNRQIDGITGATLSVGAVTRVVEVALFLSEQVRSST